MRAMHESDRRGGEYLLKYSLLILSVDGEVLVSHSSSLVRGKRPPALVGGLLSSRSSLLFRFPRDVWQ